MYFNRKEREKKKMIIDDKLLVHYRHAPRQEK